MKKDISSVVLPIDVISCIMRGDISKVIKKASVKVCKACKGEGFFKGVNVHCSKCNKTGYTGSTLKIGTLYKCKISMKLRCFYAKIKITDVKTVVPANIIDNESFSDYGFKNKNAFKRFMGSRDINNLIWEISFKVTSVSKPDDIRKMQKYDNGRTIDGSIPWI